MVKGKFHIVPNPASRSRQLCGGEPTTINILWLNHRDFELTEESIKRYKSELVCKTCVKVLQRLKKEHNK